MRGSEKIILTRCSCSLRFAACSLILFSLLVTFTNYFCFLVVTFCSLLVNFWFSLFVRYLLLIACYLLCAAYCLLPFVCRLRTPLSRGVEKPQGPSAL